MHLIKCPTVRLLTYMVTKCREKAAIQFCTDCYGKNKYLAGRRRIGENQYVCCEDLNIARDFKLKLLSEAPSQNIKMLVSAVERLGIYGSIYISEKARRKIEEAVEQVDKPCYLDPAWASLGLEQYKEYLLVEGNWIATRDGDLVFAKHDKAAVPVVFHSAEVTAMWLEKKWAELNLQVERKESTETYTDYLVAAAGEEPSEVRITKITSNNIEHIHADYEFLYYQHNSASSGE